MRLPNNNTYNNQNQENNNQIKKKESALTAAYTHIISKFEGRIYLQRCADNKTTNIYLKSRNVLSPWHADAIGRELQAADLEIHPKSVAAVLKKLAYADFEESFFLDSSEKMDKLRLLCRNYAFVIHSGKEIDIIPRSKYAGRPFFSETDFEYLGPNISLDDPRLAKTKAFFESLEISEEIKTALCECLGFALLPITSGFYRAFYLLFGPGRNGKSVWLDIIRGICGSRAADLRMIDFEDRSRFGLDRLQTSNVLLLPDTRGGCIDTEAFKRITSGDPITIEAKGGDKISIKHPFAMIGACNTLPSWAEQDAVLSRLIIIPLRKSFSGAACDPRMAEKILQEKDALATYCLNLLISKIRSGADLERCKEEQERILSNNSLIDFLSASYAPAEGSYISRAEIAADYMKYIFSEGYSLEDDPYLGRDGHIKRSSGFYADILKMLRCIYPAYGAQIRERQPRQCSRAIMGIKRRAEAEPAEDIPLPMKQRQSDLI